MEGRSPAQLYALVFGVVLVGAGILGFFYEASFATGDKTLVERDAVLGILDVNGWHNLVHILSGVIGLLVVGSYANARVYALAFGGIYIIVAILGFIYGDGDSIFKIVPVNTEDNILHALIGVAGLGAGMATPAEPAPTTAATAP
jgi:drug/metabolite transporter superfamily protein YnfA